MNIIDIICIATISILYISATIYDVIKMRKENKRIIDGWKNLRK